MSNSWETAVFATACTVLLVLVSASRPVTNEGLASGRQLLQGFGSNTLDGFRPGLQSGNPCPAGMHHCNAQNACLNLQSDSLNCGRCANACDFNTEACIGGRCSCKPGTTFCTNVGKCFSNCNGFEPEANSVQAQPVLGTAAGQLGG